MTGYCTAAEKKYTKTSGYHYLAEYLEDVIPDNNALP